MSHHFLSRLIVCDREARLDVYGPVAVGDTLDAIRGNGMREGERIGTATVTGFYEDGTPMLSFDFDPAECGRPWPS